jgi:hypothetical protein
MKKFIAAAFLLGAVTGAADAMPLAPAGSAPDAGIIRVAGGCGPGWHRGPYGGCLRNYADPDAHACPRGYHVGPYGGCRGNGR